MTRRAANNCGTRGDPEGQPRLLLQRVGCCRLCRQDHLGKLLCGLQKVNFLKVRRRETANLPRNLPLAFCVGGVHPHRLALPPPGGTLITPLCPSRGRIVLCSSGTHVTENLGLRAALSALMPVGQLLGELVGRFGPNRTGEATIQCRVHAAVRLRAKTGTEQDALHAHDEITALIFPQNRSCAVVDCGRRMQPEQALFLLWSFGHLWMV